MPAPLRALSSPPPLPSPITHHPSHQPSPTTHNTGGVRLQKAPVCGAAPRRAAPAHRGVPLRGHARTGPGRAAGARATPRGRQGLLEAAGPACGRAGHSVGQQAVLFLRCTWIEWPLAPCHDHPRARASAPPPAIHNRARRRPPSCLPLTPTAAPQSWPPSARSATPLPRADTRGSGAQTWQSFCATAGPPSSTGRCPGTTRCAERAALWCQRAPCPLVPPPLCGRPCLNPPDLT